MSNSIKFTDKGGITVKVTREITGGDKKEEKPHKTGRLTKKETENKKQESSILVEVKDTGKGLSKDLIAKLFERFVRDEKTAKEVEGTGLGLYNSKQFVLAHGGEIWAESDGEGKGSRFFVRLPKNP